MNYITILSIILTCINVFLTIRNQMGWKRLYYQLKEELNNIEEKYKILIKIYERELSNKALYKMEIIDKYFEEKTKRNNDDAGAN